MWFSWNKRRRDVPTPNRSAPPSNWTCPHEDTFPVYGFDRVMVGGLEEKVPANGGHPIGRECRECGTHLPACWRCPDCVWQPNPEYPERGPAIALVAECDHHAAFTRW